MGLGAHVLVFRGRGIPYPRPIPLYTYENLWKWVIGFYDHQSKCDFFLTRRIGSDIVLGKSRSKQWKQTTSRWTSPQLLSNMQVNFESAKVKIRNYFDWAYLLWKSWKCEWHRSFPQNVHCTVGKIYTPFNIFFFSEKKLSAISWFQEISEILDQYFFKVYRCEYLAWKEFLFKMIPSIGCFNEIGLIYLHF